MDGKHFFKNYDSVERLEQGSSLGCVRILNSRNFDPVIILDSQDFDLVRISNRRGFDLVWISALCRLCPDTLVTIFSRLVLLSLQCEDVVRRGGVFTTKQLRNRRSAFRNKFGITYTVSLTEFLCVSSAFCIAIAFHTKWEKPVWKFR